MNSRALGKRIRLIEEQVAHHECAEYERFFGAILVSLDESLHRKLTEVHRQVRERMSDIIWPNRHCHSPRRNYQRKDTDGKRRNDLSERRIQISLAFARADRDDLLQHGISPLLQALQQALDELVPDGALRLQVLEDAREELCQVLDRFRPAG